MEYLFLKDVVKSMGGKVVHGRSNVLIKTVIQKHFSTVWTSNTMIFHFNPTQELKINPGLDGVIVVTSNPEFILSKESSITVVQVKNVSKAYWKFMWHYRRRMKVPFVTIMSRKNNKIREIIEWIIHGRLSFNSLKKIKNHKGIRLLSLKKSKKAAVIDFPTNQMNETYHMYKPNYIILPEPEVYIDEMNVLLSKLGENETVVLNVSNTITMKHPKLITYGFTTHAEFFINDIKYGKNQTSFSLRYENNSYSFTVQGYGEDLVLQATAAIIVAYKLGVEVLDITKRLGAFQFDENKLRLLNGINGALMLKDSSNMEGKDLHHSLRVLSQIEEQRKKIAVLKESDLKDLELVKRMLTEYNINTVLIVHENYKNNRIQEDSKVIYCKNSNEAYSILLRLLDKNSVFLIHSNMRKLCTKLSRA
ncbi:hypothetical protein FZW96_15080 [Bacillus sp. BGMRC 2118]|nr:hypothetical protein FZW96_15080 [Bacillus sp. BGMRC 2118]